MNLAVLKNDALLEIKNAKAKFISFVEKGAEKKKTKIKLKELTESRLSQIPNYLAVEVAKKRIDLTKDAAIVGLLVLLIMLSVLVLGLFTKLDERVVALVPGRIEKVTEVQPGKIPPGALYRKVSSYISLLGNLDNGNIDFNYDLLREVMTEELKVKFWTDSSQLRRVVKDKSLSQTVSFEMKDISLSTKGKVVSALVRVKVKPMYGDEVGKVREEYILLEGSVVVKKEDNFWMLELFNLEQGPIQDIDRVKRRIRGGS